MKYLFLILFITTQGVAQIKETLFVNYNIRYFAKNYKNDNSLSLFLGKKVYTDNGILLVSIGHQYIHNNNNLTFVQLKAWVYNTAGRNTVSAFANINVPLIKYNNLKILPIKKNFQSAIGFRYITNNVNNSIELGLTNPNFTESETRIGLFLSYNHVFFYKRKINPLKCPKII